MVMAVGSIVLLIWNLNRTGWAGLSESAEPRTGDVVAEGAD
jgi:hypothetical protein